jgi:hypothetical protein
LANERYADFLLHHMSENKEEAEYRLEEAIRFYSEWGAARKVDILRHSHPEIWPMPKSISFP